jgi:hypothetical protein
MHRPRFVFGFTALFLTTGIVVIAEQGHGGGPKPQRPTTPQATTAVKPSAAVPPKGAEPAASQKMMKPATAPKAMKPAAPQKPVKTTQASQMKAATPDKASTAKVAKTDKTKPTTAVAATTPTTANVALTPVQEKLKKNTNLATKLTARLPAGTDLMAAAAGFRNLGQFVAAVNVSNNLGIPFADLKTRMVTDGKSLGQAIQALKPVASPTVEAQHAEYDARGMIADSEQQPTSAAVPVTAPSSAAATTSKTKTTTKKPMH